MTIRVNHADLRSVARAIDTYCDAQDREMNTANSAVETMLSSSWRGPDATAFRNQWAGVHDRDSFAVRYRDSLRNYANALSASADIYRRAQVDTVNSAGLLMRLVGR